MKLHISILASALAITASIHGMEMNDNNQQSHETSAQENRTNPASTATNDSHKPGLVEFLQATHGLKDALNRKDKKLLALRICCCPCNTIAAICDSFCPKVTININQGSASNNS